ncbi:MAG TPA: alkaline phosphatase family protein [Caulobacteraceae bacterium]|jgi:arylsulfatase A-like enzyme|nr:alkaline phosphatase family protein [Caulobacteraceae bacterium]
MIAKRFGPGMLAILVLAAAAVFIWLRFGSQPHNVIIFVSDGLRSGIVTPQTAPALAAVRSEGVDLQNSHSLFPTVTTPNASAIATGHRLGDTGDFGNSIYAGSPAMAAAYSSLIAGLEDDLVIQQMNERFGGNYLHETSLLAAARAAGYSTAAIGKLGPVGVQDVTSRRDGTIIIDDNSGTPDGEPLAPEIVRAIKAVGLPWPTPDRGLNTDPGDYIRPGVHVANVEQQDWFAHVVTEVLLPRFKAAHKPFVLVFWSRDPDGTQHGQGDSLNTITPGINGPTSLAAIRNASNNLQHLRDALKRLGLDNTTDIVATADHGFSTLSRQSATSAAARLAYRDVPKGFLPPGFLAIDLADALGLPLYEPNALDVELKDGFHPRHSSAVLGPDPLHPEVVIGANGGADLIWLPKDDARALVERIVKAVVAEDYTGAVFVRDDLGSIPGTLPTSAIGLKGAALTPAPAIVISFRSYSSGCAKPDTCGVEVADNELQQGQGIHGAFSRADTRNFMAAVGPDFKTGFVDPAPVSNADLAPTLARILRLHIESKGQLGGRVLKEILRTGTPPAAEARVLRSRPAANGFQTILNLQMVGDEAYFDAAGAPGRTLGLKP